MLPAIQIFLPIHQHQVTNQFYYCPITYEPRCSFGFIQKKIQDTVEPLNSVLEKKRNTPH